MKKIVLVLFCVATFVAAQAPKREFRSAWVASVSNLDWPSSPHLSVEDQKEELIEILDGMKAVNCNAVIFQIRPECDALYDSPYEPWSYWLTGKQGEAPDPMYDPLTFAIEESHKRGMELHAWFNPYRAVRTVGQYTQHATHITNTNPDWVMTFGTLTILNPGIPEVREYNAQVIADVIRRYDVDGIHMDDYFYPYPPNQIANEDNATFQQYPNGFTNIGDWRRDNVNRMMQMIMDSVNVIKPYVKFGISPFGIWKNGVPNGITGMDAYNVIYADPMAWLHDGAVDYLTPQLYWKIGGGQDYNALSQFWADSTFAYDRHIYPGHIFRSGYSNTELPNQLDIDRANPKITGSVWFKATDLVNNVYGFYNIVKNTYYKYPALPPVMSWKDTLKPETPANLVYDRLEGKGYAALQWEAPSAATVNDEARFYTIYKFDNNSVNPDDFEVAENILDIVGSAGAEYPTKMGDSPVYFSVTALDRGNNESLNSNLVEVAQPAVTELVFPANNAVDARDTLQLTWNYAEGAASYQLQVASDASFNDILVNEKAYLDTTYKITEMNGLTDYYWRTKSENIAGEGDYSEVYKYTTAFPAVANLIYPPNNTGDIPLLGLTFEWNQADAAQEYHLQVARSASFSEPTIIIDTIGVTDTTITKDLNDLSAFHFWRVRAKNEFGYGVWTPISRFKTSTTGVEESEPGIPEAYQLSQNYPNPFNPVTTISFQIPENNLVNLRVYNVLGEMVAELVNNELNAGYYSAKFDATELTSGIYIYVLKTKGFVSSKKMLLVK